MTKKRDQKAANGVIRKYYVLGEGEAIRTAFEHIFDNAEEFPAMYNFRHMPKNISPVADLSPIPMLAEIAVNVTNIESILDASYPEIWHRLRCISENLTRTFATERLLSNYWLVVPTDNPAAQIAADQLLVQGRIRETELDHAMMHLLPKTQHARIQDVETRLREPFESLMPRQEAAIRAGDRALALLAGDQR